MATTIEVQGQTLTLSPDQDSALDACSESLSATREAVLAGAAGTGKTTVMRAVFDRWPGEVMFLAPTGKAANRLSEQTGQPARTIHSAIFGTVDERKDERNARREKLSFGELHPPEGCTRSTLVAVDEASMVNGELAEQLRAAVTQAGASLQWIGDHEQLPPVEGGWGVRLSDPTARLDQVHRQALESPVLELATCIRERRAQEFSRWGDEVSRRRGSTVEQAVAWAEGGDDRVLLTWTNKVRKTANRLTRQSRGYPRGQVQPGETLICTFNKHTLGVMNGETFTVATVEPDLVLTEVLDATIAVVTTECGRELLVAPEAFDAYHPRKSDRQLFRDVWSPLYPPRDEYPALLDRMDWTPDDLTRLRERVKARSVQATWGYCLTVHKSQGSQWREVGFVSCPGFRKPERDGGRLSPDNKRRMTYTAVTRAVEGFHAFMLDTVPDYRRSNPYAK